MKKVLLLSAVASAMLMAGGDIAPVQPVTTEAPAPAEFLIFNNIYAKGEIRPRYEYVNGVNNTLGTGQAYTNRLMLGIGADFMQIDGLSVYLEGINVAGSGDYRDLEANNGNRGLYEVVADPSQTRITQAYLDYKLSDTLVRVGRQGVNLDNQRFVGTVNWRQMPQTYDAVAVINNSIENLNLLAAYVWHVNTIFGPDTVIPVGDGFDTSSTLLHAAYTFMPELKVTAYGYLLKNIHDTYGIAATGKIGVADNAAVNYRLEYASQKNASIGESIDGNGNKIDIDADYYNIQATLNYSGFLVGAQYEVLSGATADGKTAFTTPLATLHAHNGWADVVLGSDGNPVATGLVDMNAMVGYNAGEYGLFKAIYHDFSSDVGSTDYGTEWDFLYKNKVPGVKGLSFLAKAAWYQTDAETPGGGTPWKHDVTKFWVMLDYKFSSK